MTRWLLAALLTTSTAVAQDASKPVTPLPLGDVLLTLPTSHIPAKGAWESRFIHRFNQSIDEGEAFHSLFGLDSGAIVGIGLSYTPRRDFQISINRSNTLDTYEVTGKYLMFQQARAIPVTAAFRVGADLRTERDIEDRTSFFAQAIVSRQFGERLELFAIPTYVTDAGRAVSGDATVALFKTAFNVPIGAAFRIRRGTSIVAEIVPPNGDLPDEFNADVGWALGIKQAVGGHFFEILLTNNNATSADQYTTSTFQGAGFDTGDLRLGFNIERRFGSRQ
jgi:uncharacterized beta barrel domain-containing protein DUF5777